MLFRYWLAYTRIGDYDMRIAAKFFFYLFIVLGTVLGVFSCYYFYGFSSNIEVIFGAFLAVLGLGCYGLATLFDNRYIARN